MELPNGVERFRCELEKLGVRVVGKRWRLKWKCPVKDLNLGYVMEDGEVWTNLAGHWTAPEVQECFESYKQSLAHAWGGEVKAGKQTRYVVKGDGSRFLFHSLSDQQLQEWIVAIKELQRAVLGLLRQS